MVKWINVVLPDNPMTESELSDLREWLKTIRGQGCDVTVFACRAIMDENPDLHLKEKNWSTSVVKMADGNLDAIPLSPSEFSVWYKKRHKRTGVASAIVWDKRRGGIKNKISGPFLLLQIIAGLRIRILEIFRGKHVMPVVPTEGPVNTIWERSALKDMIDCLHGHKNSGYIFFASGAHEDFVAWSECLYHYPELRATNVHIFHTSNAMRDYALKQSVRSFLESDVLTVKTLMGSTDNIKL